MNNEMSSKERILNAITGKEVDRMPWSPFLAYYWNYLDESTRKKGQLSYIQDMGADPLMRGSHVLFNATYQNCTVREKLKGKQKETIYDTPVGNLSMIHTYSESGNTWYLTKHPVSNKNDFKILQYIYENTLFEEKIKKYEKDKIELGEKGLYVPLLGTTCKSAFQSLIEHWCGTVNLTYALFDFEDTVNECLITMQKKNMETVDIALKTSAEAFIFWEDTSTTNSSPDMFKKYIRPEINQWGDKLHSDHRLLIHHACGLLKNIMPLIGESNIDVLESISPPPTGDIEIVDARKILPEHIAIIGGIEPVKLLHSSLEELKESVISLIENMKGTRYILANSDSCPPGVEIEKFKLVSQLVRN